MLSCMGKVVFRIIIYTNIWDGLFLGWGGKGKGKGKGKGSVTRNLVSYPTKTITPVSYPIMRATPKSTDQYYSIILVIIS